MFFLLSKILLFLLSPTIWIIALLVYSIWTKNEKRRKRAVFTLITIFIIITNTFLTQKVVGAWEIEKQNIEETKTYEVGVLLGGYTLELKETYDFTTLSKNGNRLIQTVELYRAGKIKKILLSGGNGMIGSEFEEAISSMVLLQKMGIPESDILVEKKSRNTYENALYSAHILNEKYPKGKFLLITSAFHQRRALACFQKQNLDCDPFAADIKSESKIPITNIITPDSENIYLWKIVIKEMVGYLVYWAKGYI